MTQDHSSSPKLIIEIIKAIDNFGGTAQLKDIYEKIKSESFIDISHYKNPESRIRTIIYDHSSDCSRFKGEPGDKTDLFYAVQGKGKGYWGLRSSKE